MDGSALKTLWNSLLPNEPQPDEQQWLLWSALHDDRTIRTAIGQLVIKYRQLGGQMAPDHQLRFASSVMNRLTREARPATL